jgi:hypothetical protein
MAASQYLRNQNLVDAVKSYLTSDVTHQTSSLVGEPESATFNLMHGVIPSLLGGLTYSRTPRQDSQRQLPSDLAFHSYCLRE